MYSYSHHFGRGRNPLEKALERASFRILESNVRNLHSDCDDRQFPPEDLFHIRKIGGAGLRPGRFVGHFLADSYTDFEVDEPEITAHDKIVAYSDWGVEPVRQYLEIVDFARESVSLKLTQRGLIVSDRWTGLIVVLDVNVFGFENMKNRPRTVRINSVRVALTFRHVVPL